MIFVFYFFAVVLIWLSFKSFRGGIAYLRFFKSELAKPRSEFTPFVTVIVPCRGLDEGLEQNLAALFDQDYPDYEVIFVVDDREDPAAAVIENISRENANLKTKLIVADKTIESSQKVENLREAVLHIADGSKVLVFVDSDARPAKDWLASLVAPLEDEQIGGTTGYRWFISPTPSFASEMRAAWNASIASALGPDTGSNFCWGGSMAIRRGVFEKLEIREKWRGTLSDDFAVSRAIKEAGLTIYFVPRALTASVESCSLRELFEFTTRQMKITRVYSPDLWKLSFFGSSVFIVTLVWAVLLLTNSSSGQLRFWAGVMTLASVSLFSFGKSWLRLIAVRLIFPQYKAELGKQFWPQNTLWLLTPALFLYNSIAAGLSRRMKWRGIVYEMISATETRIETHIERR